MSKTDFHIELNSSLNDEAEARLLEEAETRLLKLANGHQDIIGAAINIRRPAKGATDYLFEATVVVYSRPENVSATEKRNDHTAALKGALSAIERQVRERRAKLRRTWERPGNDPVSQEVLETELAEGDNAALLDDIDTEIS